MNKLLAVAATVLTVAVLLVPCVSATSNFIYVANTGENTVSKIDITLNQEVARYPTWFGTAFGPAPSRIARDTNDNAYVLNRFFTNHLPVLLKIAPSGGTNTSSGSGLGAVLAMQPDTTNVGHIDPGEITDNRILWASEIGTVGSDEGKLGRALCMDTQGLLWVGIFSNHKYYQVNPATGIMTGVSVDTTVSHNPYGCQVDMNGKLWSVNSGTSLAEIDTKTNTFVGLHNHPISSGCAGCGYNYSLSLYNDCTSTPAKVTVYLSDSAGKTYIAYDPQANSFSNPAAVQVRSISVGVDRKGNVVSGAYTGTGEVIKHSPSGALIWNQPGTSTCTSNCASPVGPAIPDFHGIIIDDNDDVWAVDRSNGRVIKYAGASGAYIATVTVGNQPYTYGNPPPPTCNVTPPPTGCVQVIDKEIHCLPNGDYSYTFTVTNNSGHSISQLLLTPVQGSTFTLAPQLATFSSPLSNGQSTTLTTTISGAKPGDKICFYVSLLADKEACCNKQVCLTMPKCDNVSPTPTVTSSPPPPTLRQQPPAFQQPPRGRRRP